ncbi:hypothetical protein OPQ81_002843 [Rhizoctonia solani]|nr:hypothetical protein OPQ81_002843 [Rhizoctonia solani]
MAGTGKTTIAYSFCEWLENTRRLGASFFCSRNFKPCSSLGRIVPTVAYQLACYSPAFRSMLCASLQHNPDAMWLNLAQQFKKLIYEPISRAKDAIPYDVVLVIDALDECNDVYSVRVFLDALFTFGAHLPLKIFVSSRPDRNIRDGMLWVNRSILHWHNIDQSFVEVDIKKYLTEALSSMAIPPSPQQIDLLARYSGSLFICAAAIVRYIRPEYGPMDSNARLEEVLRGLSASNQGIKLNIDYRELDDLYTTALEAAFGQRGQPELESMKDCMRGILWTIVQKKGPMTMGEISALSGLSERQVWPGLQPLRSVPRVPQNSLTVSVVHPSFREYMLDQTRPGEFCCNNSRFREALDRYHPVRNSSDAEMMIQRGQGDSDSGHDASINTGIEADIKPSGTGVTEHICSQMVCIVFVS